MNPTIEYLAANMRRALKRYVEYSKLDFETNNYSALSLRAANLLIKLGERDPPTAKELEGNGKAMHHFLADLETLAAEGAKSRPDKRAMEKAYLDSIKRIPKIKGELMEALRR